MVTRRETIRAALALAGAAAGIPRAAWAQSAADYPNRPIKIIVPFVPGGATDLLGRMLAEKLQKAWGQPVVVENKPGAGAMVGSEFVARAPADGYTLLVTNTALIQNVALNPKTPFDPLKDFAAITQLTISPIVFCVPEAVPARSIAEFVALVKANPKKYSYGSAGVGQTLHLYGEVLNKAAGIDLAHVPYKGEAAMVGDLVAGQIAAGFASFATTRPFIAAKKVFPIGVAGTARITALPDVPTFRESGYPQFDAIGWFGLFTTGGAPRPIVEKLATEIHAILKMPDVAGKLNELVLPPVGNGPEAFSSVMASDLKAWTQIVKDTGIKVE